MNYGPKTQIIFSLWHHILRSPLKRDFLKVTKMRRQPWKKFTGFLSQNFFSSHLYIFRKSQTKPNKNFSPDFFQKKSCSLNPVTPTHMLNTMVAQQLCSYLPNPLKIISAPLQQKDFHFSDVNLCWWMKSNVCFWKTCISYSFYNATFWKPLLACK